MKLYDSIKNILKESDSKLTEGNWEYQLKSGQALRKAINDNDDSTESWVRVLNAIKTCCEELKTILGEDDVSVKDLIDDCDFYIDTIDTEEDESNIDYCLDKLYDICDGNNIWIPLMNSEESIQEAANPENAEANALIRQALDDKRFAVEHKKDLEKLGLRVDVSEYTKSDGTKEISDVYLTGPNGRKLQSAYFNWDRHSTGDFKPSDDAYKKDGINQWDEKTGKYKNVKNLDKDFTLSRRTYGEAKKKVSDAKQDLPRLKKRLNLYAKRYGEDSSQYRELKRDIDSRESTIKQGITPRYSENRSKDVDYLNYLNKPLRSDRPQARRTYNSYSVNSEPVGRSNDGTEIDKANELSRKYKKTKDYQDYNNRQKEDNLRRDKEDEERVQNLIKSNKEEKDRRDYFTAKADKSINKDFSDIAKRLDAYKKRLGKKQTSKKESELNEAIEQKYEKTNPDYNRFLKDVKHYTGSYIYLFGGKVSAEYHGLPITVNYFYYNRPYAEGGNNVVINVLSPYGTCLYSLHDAINEAFEKNSKTRLSNKEIKDKILEVINSMDKK